MFVITSMKNSLHRVSESGLLNEKVSYLPPPSPNSSLSVHSWQDPGRHELYEGYFQSFTIWSKTIWVGWNLLRQRHLRSAGLHRRTSFEGIIPSSCTSGIGDTWLFIEMEWINYDEHNADQLNTCMSIQTYCLDRKPLLEFQGKTEQSPYPHSSWWSKKNESA